MAHDDVLDVWELFPSDQRARRLPPRTARQLAAYDRPTLTEAADLVVKTAGKLEPSLWLQKARIGANVHEVLRLREGAPVVRLPETFDPFAGDPAPRAYPGHR